VGALSVVIRLRFGQRARSRVIAPIQRFADVAAAMLNHALTSELATSGGLLQCAR
jgi:hypothetical protein